MVLRRVWGFEENIAVVGAAATTSDRYLSGVQGTTVPSIETSIVRTGARSLKLTPGATDPGFRLIHTATRSVVNVYGAFRITDATPTSITDIVYWDTAAGSDAQLRITTGGVLQATFGGGAGGATVSGPTLTADEWWVFEAQLDVSANPNTIKWRTRNPTSGAWTDHTAASLAQAATSVGSTYGPMITAPTDITSYADDFAIWDGTTPDEHYAAVARDLYVVNLLPTSDGTHSISVTEEFQNQASADILPSSTTVYQLLDDADMTAGLTDYVKQIIAGAGKYVEVHFDNLPAGIDTPVGVGVTSAHLSAGTAANEMHMRISDDGTNWTNLWGDWASAGYDTSETSNIYLQASMASKPSTGAWTRSTVDSLRLRWGNSDDVTPNPYFGAVQLAVLMQVTKTVSPSLIDQTAVINAPTVTNGPAADPRWPGLQTMMSAQQAVSRAGGW